MIVYFSGTGNSLYAAKKLAEGTGDKLLSIAEFGNGGEIALRTDEALGFVFPVYFFGVPKPCVDFVSNLSVSAYKPFVYSVLVCGGTTASAGKAFAKLLAKRGIKRSLACSVKMPDNYIPMYDIQSNQQNEDTLKVAEKTLDDIILHIKNRDCGDYDKFKGSAPALMTALLYPFYRLARRTKSFFAEPTCNGCGLCEKICPTKCIKLSDGKPVWTAESCALCLACIHRCPKRAIQYGKSTVARGRYVHPILKQKENTEDTK